MRLRILWRFALAFFLSSLFIVLVNIGYMQSSVYSDRSLYRYDPTALLASVRADFTVDSYGRVSLLDQAGASPGTPEYSVQVLDDSLSEVFRADSLGIVMPPAYTPARLAALYEREDFTVFMSDLRLQDKDYTLVLYVKPTDIARSLYTYDPGRVSRAYNAYWLVGMNILLLLTISYFYTYSVTTPLSDIIQRVLRLAQGDYGRGDRGKGIYAQVGKALDDLAERLESAKRQAEQAESAREEWIANLSHDIKTPLTSILGYTELVCHPDYELSQAERDRYKELILEKGGIIKDLIEELNTLARLTNSDYPLRLEQVNLVEEIRNHLISALNSPLLRETSHTMEFNPVMEVVPARIDRRLFRRALDNLVYNAFIHNDRPITLRADVSNDSFGTITITLDDNGIGAPEEELEKLFDRYYQGMRSKEKKRGNGLGLAIAKQIIELHGGRIHISRSPRGGLLVRLQLRSIQNEALS